MEIRELRRRTQATGQSAAQKHVSCAPSAAAVPCKRPGCGSEKYLEGRAQPSARHRASKPLIALLTDYFSLQLAVARQYARAARVTPGAAIDRCTNLRRRFGLLGPAGAARWQAFLAHADQVKADEDAVLSWCATLYVGRPVGHLGRAFGCFSYDPPDSSSGALRIHFVPPDDVGQSPLALASIGARLDELRAMFAHIRRHERGAASVRGVSWLYNLDAYKRLFPANYVAAIRAPGFPLHLNGSSTWGQVLNWRQAVKPVARDALLARLPTLRAEAPWEIFPYPALTATCEIDAFHEHFG